MVRGAPQGVRGVGRGAPLRGGGGEKKWSGGPPRGVRGGPGVPPNCFVS